MNKTEEVESESGDEVYLESHVEEDAKKKSLPNQSFNQVKKKSLVRVPELPDNMDIYQLSYNASVQANKIMQNIKNDF